MGELLDRVKAHMAEGQRLWVENAPRAMAEGRAMHWNSRGGRSEHYSSEDRAHNWNRNSLYTRFALGKDWE